MKSRSWSTVISTTKRRYPKEEFARRGRALYDKLIRRTYESSHDGQFVAIDIETGEFEIDPNDMDAVDRLYERLPNAQPYSFGLGNLWRIATEYPGSPVPPCIHRAPDIVPGQPPRLILIS